MRHIIIYICVAVGLISSSDTYAQNMRDIVRNMPDSILPLLSKNNRLDFIDYLDSNMKAEVINKMGGKSEMTTITDDYAHIHLTGCSEIALKVLQHSIGHIICMIQTFKSDANDSQITFYSADWKELAADEFIKKPQGKDFFTPSDSLSTAERENILNKLDVNMIKAEFESGTTNLIMIFTTPQLMTEEDKKLVKPHLKENITLIWNGERFE